METKTYENIIYEKKGPIAYIILNRPEKMNALSPALMEELSNALEDAGWNDDNIKVIVMKGAGRCFGTGFDLTPTAVTAVQRDTAQTRARMLRMAPHSTRFWDLTWKNPKPIITQVHSFCLAASLGIVAMCDICICSEDALFGYPRVRDLGPTFTSGLTPWLLGMRKAKEFLLTGNMFDGQEAYRLGYVNKVVPRDKLDEEVDKMAQTIAKVPAIANEYSKVLVNMAYDLMGIRTVWERSIELEAVCGTASDETSPERAEFKRLRVEKGLKAALKYRYDRFAEEDAWWRERQQKNKTISRER